MKNNRYKNNLIKFLDKIGIGGLSGDILEIGTYKGDTTEIICEYIFKKKINKKIFTIDTFNGYIKSDITESAPPFENTQFSEIVKKNFNEGRWKHTKKQVDKRLQKYNNFVTVWEGDSKKIIPKYKNKNIINNISLLYVDCNLYLPSLEAIKDIYPIMSKGGVITIDEHWLDKYGKYGGETKALFEFAKSINITPTHYNKESGPSYYIIKEENIKK